MPDSIRNQQPKVSQDSADTAPALDRTPLSRKPEKPEYRIKLCQKGRAMYDKAIRAQRKAQEQA